MKRVIFLIPMSLMKMISIKKIVMSQLTLII
nr:MAG TPA: hypothetical protein [Caudoviricetes sp.]